MIQILTVLQAAEQLQVSDRTLYGWLRAGKIPGRKIGKVWRISGEAIAEFLRGDPAEHDRNATSSRKKNGRP